MSLTVFSFLKCYLYHFEDVPKFLIALSEKKASEKKKQFSLAYKIAFSR